MSFKVTPILICALSMLASTTVHAYEVDKARHRITLDSLDDFERCHQKYPSSDVCVDALSRYVKANPKAGFGAGKLVRTRFRSWMALQFFVPTLTKALPETSCDDEDLRLAVLAGLALPTEDPNQALAAKAAGGVCAAKLQPHIRNGFGDANAYYRTNACAVLKTLGAAPVVCGANPQ